MARDHENILSLVVGAGYGPHCRVYWQFEDDVGSPYRVSPMKLGIRIQTERPITVAEARALIAALTAALDEHEQERKES